MRHFAGIDLGNEPVPDETTVCKFRHLLEEHRLGGEILETVNLYLQQRGVRISTGTIVDATIIHATSSTRNQQGARPGDAPDSQRKAVVLPDKGARCPPPDSSKCSKPACLQAAPQIGQYVW